MCWGVCGTLLWHPCGVKRSVWARLQQVALEFTLLHLGEMLLTENCSQTGASRPPIARFNRTANCCKTLFETRGGNRGACARGSSDEFIWPRLKRCTQIPHLSLPIEASEQPPATEEPPSSPTGYPSQSLERRLSIHCCMYSTNGIESRCRADTYTRTNGAKPVSSYAARLVDRRLSSRR